MNLYEFKKSLESDATVENEKLKKEIEDLKKKYEAKIKQLEINNKALDDDCRALSNRCWVNNSLMAGGTMCYFCSLGSFRCPHEIDLDKKIKFVKKEMKKNENSAYLENLGKTYPHN